MSNIGNKTGKFLGKVVKGATAAPGKTGNLLKTVTHEVKERVPFGGSQGERQPVSELMFIQKNWGGLNSILDHTILSLHTGSTQTL